MSIEWKRVKDHGQPSVGAMVSWEAYDGRQCWVENSGYQQWDEKALWITAAELAELLPFDRIAAPPNPLQAHIDALREAGWVVSGPAMTMTPERAWLPIGARKLSPRDGICEVIEIHPNSVYPYKLQFPSHHYDDWFSRTVEDWPDAPPLVPEGWEDFFNLADGHKQEVWCACRDGSVATENITYRQNDKATGRLWWRPVVPGESRPVHPDLKEQT